MHVGHGEGRLSLADALGLNPAQVEAKPLQGQASTILAKGRELLCSAPKFESEEAQIQARITLCV